MRLSLIALALAMCGPAMAADDCRALEGTLLGAWQASGGGGFFEEMAFSIEDNQQRFDSWLHQRPELLDASWRLDGCHLTIEPGREGWPAYRYTIAIRRDKLHLRKAESRETAIYSRIPEQP